MVVHASLLAHIALTASVTRLNYKITTRQLHEEFKMTHGGAREGAGRRPKKLTPADASAALLTAAVYELSIGQSSVELAMDSKGAVKPTVKAYAKTARAASRTAQAVFDELVKKYNPSEPEPKK